MTLMGSGTVAHIQSPASNGGAIKHHYRPCQLQEGTKVEYEQHRKFLQPTLDN